jgi:uncharacterized YccA/Bax inhibitor family protein
MQSSNPVLGKAFNQPSNALSQDSYQELEKVYQAPAASSIRTGRMTIEDVVAKTGFLFGLLVIVGAFAWSANLGMGTAMIGFIGAFVLAMVISFSKTVKPALVVAYAALQGLAIGTISHFYEGAYPGIVSQAVIGTIAAFAGVYGYVSQWSLTCHTKIYARCSWCCNWLLYFVICFIDRFIFWSWTGLWLLWSFRSWTTSCRSWCSNC